MPEINFVDFEENNDFIYATFSNDGREYKTEPFYEKEQAINALAQIIEDSGNADDLEALREELFQSDGHSSLSYMEKSGDDYESSYEKDEEILKDHYSNTYFGNSNDVDDEGTGTDDWD